VAGVVEHLQGLGGVAGHRLLIDLTSRAELAGVLAAGDVVKIARGRYALATTDETTRLLVAAGGVLARASAAVHHGWAVKTVPTIPDVVVPRWRDVDPTLRRRLNVHPVRRMHVSEDGMATDVESTLVDCLRHLPFDEALAIADSALRAGVGPSLLDRIADSAVGPGAPAIRRVASRATPLAANPFESVLRAIAEDVPGLDVVPQVSIRETGLRARPDLVDRRLRVVLEADSFEWHGGREALARDARRYNALVINGWMVLRFSWDDVMHDPASVREVLVAAVALAELLNKVGIGRRAPA
jgi:very-short-patch-repair endonuclease